MKRFLKVVVLLIVVLLTFYYTGNRAKENILLEAPVKSGTALPVQKRGVGEVIPESSRPSKGLSVLVGGSAEALVKLKGEPNRIEPSGYGYDWWIYLEEEQFMAGVTTDSIVNQLYSTELTADVSPFEIGQDIGEIYRFTIVDPEINVEIEDNIYTFSLNSKDLQDRLLILYKGLLAQLYIDSVTGALEAVRFIDPTTLVLHQPYEMTYMGKLPSVILPSSLKQLEVDRATEKQIFELTNLYRIKADLPKLRRRPILDQFERDHSEMLAMEKYLPEELSEPGSLTSRLKTSLIVQEKAAENIASDYIDAIEAVHGWHNSQDHRKVLLGKDFTHLGVGAYGNVYSQGFYLLTEEEW